VRGFEMHIGRTTGADTARPMLDLDGRPDGAISADGRVMGTYLHGIFADDAFRHDVKDVEGEAEGTFWQMLKDPKAYLLALVYFLLLGATYTMVFWLPTLIHSWGVKDPVIVRGREGWQMWACYHPLAQPGQEDRMISHHLTSVDGLVWRDHGAVLRGTGDTWDARGARVTAVLDLDPLTLLYDGRATAADNWFEATGLAREVDGVLQSIGDAPIAASPNSDGALRYVSAVRLPDGRTRFYFEAAQPDGSHDLMTSVSSDPFGEETTPGR